MGGGSWVGGVGGVGAGGVGNMSTNIPLPRGARGVGVGAREGVRGRVEGGGCEEAERGRTTLCATRLSRNHGVVGGGGVVGACAELALMLLLYHRAGGVW